MTTALAVCVESDAALRQRATITAARRDELRRRCPLGKSSAVKEWRAGVVNRSSSFEFPIGCAERGFLRKIKWFWAEMTINVSVNFRLLRRRQPANAVFGSSRSIGAYSQLRRLRVMSPDVPIASCLTSHGRTEPACYSS